MVEPAPADAASAAAVAGEPPQAVEASEAAAVEAAAAEAEAVEAEKVAVPLGQLPGGLGWERAPVGTESGDLAPGTDTVRSGLLQAGPLAAAGLVANGANLIVTVLLARLLTTHGYGSYNQLVGLFLVVSLPGTAVAVAVVRRVTGWHTARTVRSWARRVHAQGALAVAAFAVVVILAGNWLAHTLGQHSAVGAIAVLAAGAIWVLLSFDRGLLQAHRNYRVLAANFLVEGGMRSVAVLVLVGMGFGVAGTAVGLFIAELTTCVHARIMADRIWLAQVRSEAGQPGAPRASVSTMTKVRRQAGRALSVLRPAPSLSGPGTTRRALVSDLVSAFIALGMLALLQNIDVIVIARDNPHQSGSYAAVSVACKAVVFVAIVLGGYLLPEAAIRWHSGTHALRQLGVTLLVLAVPAVVLLGVAVAAPRLLLSLVFSAKYLGASKAFVPLALAMICLSVSVVLTMYLLAVGRRWVSALLVLGAALATAAVVHAGGHPVATARADLVVQALLVAVIAVGFVLVHQRRAAALARAQP